MWDGLNLEKALDISVWPYPEPDGLGSDFCVRVDFRADLRTKKCSVCLNVVCEFTTGTCSSKTLPGVTMTNMMPYVTFSNVTSLSACWAECLQLFMFGKECVAVEWTATSAVCKLYIANSLLTETNVDTAQRVGTYIMLRTCFSDEVTDGPNTIRCSDSNTNTNPNPSVDERALAIRDSLLQPSSPAVQGVAKANENAGTVAGNWTLYTGLSLTWNDASRFCRDQGGHLPVINTQVAMSGLTEAVDMWKAQQMLTQNFWIGLYSNNGLMKPYMWEGVDMALSPDVDYWQNLTALDQSGGVCVMMDVLWAPGGCNNQISVVCEFSGGCCNYDVYPEKALLLQEPAIPDDYAAASCLEECWGRCLDLRMSGSECVAAEWEESSAVCKLYTRNSFFSVDDSETSPGTSLLLRKCFSHDVNTAYTSNAPNGSNTAQQTGTSSDPSPAPPLPYADNSFTCDTASTFSCPGETSTVPTVTTTQQRDTTTMSTTTTSEPTVASTTQGDITVSGNTTIVPVDASSDATTMDFDTTAVSGDTAIMPIDTSTVQVTMEIESTTVSGDTTIVPIDTSSEATTMDFDTTAVSGDTAIVPIDASTDQVTMEIESTTVSGDTTTSVSGGTAVVPIDTSSDATSMDFDTTVVSDETAIVQIDASTMERDTTTVSGGTTIVPIDVSTEATSTVPSATATVPVATDAIQRGIPPKLCPCKKVACQRSHWRPSPLNLSVVPRKSTSKYRRHVTSTWSGTSRSQIILGVTMTTVSILTAGLFLYCNVRRLTTIFGDGGGRGAGGRDKGTFKGRRRKKGKGPKQQARRPAE
ncbi:hypothetical protein BaRGS_00029213, partial [Batillaria attramentaria]